MAPFKLKIIYAKIGIKKNMLRQKIKDKNVGKVTYLFISYAHNFNGKKLNYFELNRT